MVLPVLLREIAPRRPADEKDPLGTGRHRLQSVLRIRPPIPYSATPFSASLRKSPAIFEEVGDFLAQVKKKVYFCTVKQKLDIQLLTAAVLSIGGMIMLYCGVFIEPQGPIHESLLIGFGEVATFAGALFGIDSTYKHKYRNNHDNTNPTTKSPDGQSSDGHNDLSLRGTDA